MDHHFQLKRNKNAEEMFFETELDEQHISKRLLRSNVPLLVIPVIIIIIIIIKRPLRSNTRFFYYYFYLSCPS